MRWLESIATLLSTAADRWSLEIGELFAGSNVSFVVRVTRRDGSPAVLKLNYPEAETEHEPDALRHWDGRRAVRFIDDAPDIRAILMERLEPADLLSTQDEAVALEIGAGILRDFRGSPPPHHSFRELDRLAKERWQPEIRIRAAMLGRPERSLVDYAIGQIDELVGTTTESVVLHQDLHAGNILFSADRGWLAIDPKPLVGDPAFDAASLLRDRRDQLASDPDPGRRVRRRLDALASLLDLNKQRMRGWGVVHALAWGMGEDGIDENLVACARWLAATRERPSG